MRGKMLWFNEAEDRGFIMTDDGERVAVAGSAFTGARPVGRCARTSVSFEIDDSNGDRQAEAVVLEADVPARRARLRGTRGMRRL
jgi:cold shock CspA family protein